MNDFMEKYLGEVDRRLRRLPVAERVDIVNELKSEIAELSAAGLSGEEIEARLGSARSLAAGYLGDAIAKSPRFSWRKLGLLAAFYSYAGLGGIIVLPVTGICAMAFLLCGVVCPIIGAVNLACELMGFDLPWVMFQIGGWTAGPWLGFVLACLTGVLLAALGLLCWKATVAFVKSVSGAKKKLEA